MPDLSSLVSPKVVAAGAGAGAGSILSSFVVWLVGVLVFGGSPAASAVEATTAAVPLPVVALVGLVLTLAGALIPGYTITDPARGSAVLAETPEGYEPQRALVEDDGDPAEEGYGAS